MKSIEQITDELVEDTLNTCIGDSNYLRSLLQVYFKNMSEEERRNQHADAFFHLEKRDVIAIDLSGSMGTIDPGLNQDPPAGPG